jgi:hypothetical protein
MRVLSSLGLTLILLSSCANAQPKRVDAGTPSSVNDTGAAAPVDFELESPAEDAEAHLLIDGIAIKQEVPVSIDAALRGFFPEDVDAFTAHRFIADDRAEYALTEADSTVLIASLERREMDQSWTVVSVRGCESAMSKYSPGIAV